MFAINVFVGLGSIIYIIIINFLFCFDSKLQYCVYLSDDGQVVSIKVSDGEYLVSLEDNQTIKDLSDNNIEKGNLDNYECKFYNEK